MIQNKKDPRQHLRSGPVRRSKRGGWTKEEDEILRQAVKDFNGKKWKSIAERLPGRTNVQCLHRWQKVLNPTLMKGFWTKEEDALLISKVQMHGAENWTMIAGYLQGRIGKQCRERWYNHLDPSIKKEPWSEEETATLIRIQSELGNKWAEISKRIPGRPSNQCKNVFNSIMAKKKKQGQNKKSTRMSKPKRKRHAQISHSRSKSDSFLISQFNPQSAGKDLFLNYQMSSLGLMGSSNQRTPFQSLSNKPFVNQAVQQQQQQQNMNMQQNQMQQNLQNQMSQVPQSNQVLNTQTLQQPQFQPPQFQQTIMVPPQSVFQQDDSGMTDETDVGDLNILNGLPSPNRNSTSNQFSNLTIPLPPRSDFSISDISMTTAQQGLPSPTNQTGGVVPHQQRFNQQPSPMGSSLQPKDPFNPQGNLVDTDILNTINECFNPENGNVPSIEINQDNSDAMTDDNNTASLVDELFDDNTREPFILDSPKRVRMRHHSRSRSFDINLLQHNYRFRPF